LIPFTVKIEDHQKDPDLAAKLLAEAEGILAWAVRGCQEWQRIRLADPGEVRAATAAYREEQDTLHDFITECCMTGTDYRDKASRLYETYQAWCKRTREPGVGQKKFGEQLEGRGYKRHLSNGTWYLGIAVANGCMEATEGRLDFCS
jgi:putative DNA primase/helicase